MLKIDPRPQFQLGPSLYPDQTGTREGRDDLGSLRQLSPSTRRSTLQGAWGLAKRHGASLFRRTHGTSAMMEYMSHQKTSFKAEVIRLPDLAVATHELKGYRFENCVIMGPAVVVPMDTTIQGCQFEGETSALLWEISPKREYVIGAIGLIECEFFQCRFTDIGFAGTSEFIEVFKGGAS